jgi:hypothetical protein
MTLDQRLTQAMQHIADDVIAPQVDVAAVRSTARAHRIRVASVAATAATALILVAATALIGGRDTSAPEPAKTTPVPQPSLTTPSMLTFKSSLYDLTLRYPSDWTPYAATQKWSWQANVKDWKGLAQDHVMSPDDPRAGEVRVSAWAAPIDPDTRKETTAYLMAFAEDYCKKSGNSPCTGIADRAVELCVEKPDCHPGLLVPFKDNVQAFFSGGNYPTDAMTIVAVWRPEWEDSVRPYGGARRLLESFLSTMDVWPNTTPSRP